MKLKSARRSRRSAASRGPTPPAGGLRLQPRFSTPGVSPFDEVEWELRTAEINDDTGKAFFKQENVEVPKKWSALATKIAVSKYFYGDIARATTRSTAGASGGCGSSFIGSRAR